MPSSEPTDVIISWMAAVPDSVLAQFTNKPRICPMPMPHDADEPNAQHYGDQFKTSPSSEHPWVIGGWPHPLRAILQHYGVSKPQRVAVFGFSQGCQGVIQLLKSKDAGYIEHAMMFDGLHCGWYPGSGPNEGRNNIEPSCLGAATAFAEMAMKGPVAIGGNPPGQHYFTLTHSSIIPPNFPATFDTAREVIARLWEDAPDAVLPPGTIGMTFDPPWIARGVKYTQDTNRYAVGENGLTIMGYNNIDPTGGADHIYQGNIVLKTVLEKLLVPRWNSVDPSVPTCTGTGAMGSAECNAIAPVTIPEDFFTNPDDASIDFLKWAGEVQEKPSLSVGGLFASALIGSGVGLGLAEIVKLLKRRWA